MDGQRALQAISGNAPSQLTACPTNHEEQLVDELNAVGVAGPAADESHVSCLHVADNELVPAEMVLASQKTDDVAGLVACIYQDKKGLQTARSK